MMYMIEPTDKLFITCDCGCDVLVLSRDDWEDGTPQSYWLAMYQSSQGSWWTRIKNAFKYLRYGEYTYTDMVIQNGDINRLINFLQGKQGPIITNGVGWEITIKE
jgi:hypothetical protein